MGCLIFWGASLMTPKAKADELDQKTVLNFDDPVQLPGIVLPAGTYVFKIVKMKTDRDVVQVLSPDETKIYATIMTVPSFRANATEDTLLVFKEQSAGEPRVIKEWFFPDRRYGHEFIYPKKEPAEMAKAEPPQSAEPAVAAEHTEPMMRPEESDESDYLQLLHQKQAESSPELAQADQSGSSNQSAEDTEMNNSQSPQQEQTPQSAMAEQLPRTASHLPLVLFSGLLLVAISFGLRVTS